MKVSVFTEGWQRMPSSEKPLFTPWWFKWCYHWHSWLLEKKFMHYVFISCLIFYQSGSQTSEKHQSHLQGLQKFQISESHPWSYDSTIWESAFLVDSHLLLMGSCWSGNYILKITTLPHHTSNPSEMFLMCSSMDLLVALNTPGHIGQNQTKPNKKL